MRRAHLEHGNVCSSVCRLRVMVPSCRAHLNTGKLLSQWSRFQGEGQRCIAIVGAMYAVASGDIEFLVEDRLDEVVLPKIG